MPNSFGHLFRITTWGESHGPAIGVTVDGCPPRLPISAAEIQAELDRRRPGQSDITTPRKEADSVEILSGVYEGRTTGTPICMLVRNTDQRSSAYSEMKAAFRPSHADFTYHTKFGIRDPNGGGRSSARETISRVAAGAIAKKILAARGLEILLHHADPRYRRARRGPDHLPLAGANRGQLRPLPAPRDRRAHDRAHQGRAL